MTNTTKLLAQDSILTPALDIYEQNSVVTILAEMPGVKNDDLNVNVDGKTMTIQGVIALPKANGKKKGREDKPYYSRTLQLSSDLDSDNIKAEFNDGLLTLKISKKPECKPKKIDIKFS